MSRRPTQRDYMRKLVRELGRDKNAVCAAYAKAERDGAVPRQNNSRGRSAEEYADALWRDGDKKGWF